MSADSEIDTPCQAARTVEQALREAYFLKIKWVKEIEAEAETDSVFKEIFEDPDKTVFWLESGTPEQRLFAWKVILGLPWRDKEALRKVSVAWMDDPDDRIAGAALNGVSLSFVGSKDVSLARRLIRIIRDPSFSPLRRGLAHSALMWLFGLEAADSLCLLGLESTSDLAFDGRSLEEALRRPFVDLLAAAYFPEER